MCELTCHACGTLNIIIYLVCNSFEPMFIKNIYSKDFKYFLKPEDEKNIWIISAATVTSVHVSRVTCHVSHLTKGARPRCWEPGTGTCARGPWCGDTGGCRYCREKRILIDNRYLDTWATTRTSSARPGARPARPPAATPSPGGGRYKYGYKCLDSFVYL